MGQYNCITLYGLPRRQEERPTSSTTTSSKAPASTASPASSTRPISAPPSGSPPWSRTAPPPVPFRPPRIDFGLPGALWLAAQQLRRLRRCSQSLWPQPRSGPSTAHYLLLAAIHRICQPGPKTEVADWYRRTILHSLWGFPRERFTSQAFWDCFDQIQTRRPPHEDELDQAQLRLLGSLEGKTTGEPPPAGLRHHQLLHLRGQHQHAQRTGAARPQQAGPP